MSGLNGVRGPNPSVASSIAGRGRRTTSVQPCRRVLKWMRATVLVLSLPAISSAQAMQIETVAGQDAAAREVLIKAHSWASGLLPLLAQTLDADLVQPIGQTGLLRVRSRSQNIPNLLNAVRQSPWVDWAEPNYVIRAQNMVPNDPDFHNLWALQNSGQLINGQSGLPFADIGAARAWDISVGSPNIAVGVLDTGVDYTHSDLAANIWTAQAAYLVSFNGLIITCPAGSHGFNALSLSCDPRDDNTHGTHVAGIIGAQGNNSLGVTGVNWTTSIAAFKFLNQYGTGQVSDLVNAIDAAVQMKAQGVNIRILNASFASASMSTALFEAITNANTNDILFVAAAANSSSNNDVNPVYPANYSIPNVMAVAATDNGDNLAPFSNYGPQRVHLGAPGVDIESTVLNNGYAFLSGTSMAAPHVAGAAALVLSKCPLNTAALKTVLLESVDPVPSLTGKTVTGGRLNVERALAYCGAPAIADFLLSAWPVAAGVQAGGSVSFQISLVNLSGFSGTALLTASGLPAGVTARFSPGSVVSSAASTLTLSTAAFTASGTYPITVTGTSGSLVRSLTLYLTVNPGDFGVSVSPAVLNVPVGGSAPFAVTITGVNGFSSSVNLEALGVPAGVSAVFDPPSVAGSGNSNLTFLVAPTAAWGDYSVTVQATSGKLLHTAMLNLKIVPAADFILSASPPSVSARAGGSGTSQITMTAKNGFSASVSLTAVALPAGITASFSPTSITISTPSTVTLAVSASVAPGSYSIAVQGASAALVHSVTVNLVVQAATAIMLPPALTLDRGTPAALPVTLSAPAPDGGVSVTLTVSDPATVSLNLGYLWIPAGQSTSTRAQMTGLKPGSASVTASAVGMLPGVVQVRVAGSAPLSITTTSLANGQVKVPYSQALTAMGGVPPYSWSVSAGTLPAGLSLNPVTGLIDGTPLAPAAAVPLSFKVTDSSVPTQSASANFTLTIVQPALPGSISAISGTPQTTVLGTSFSSPLAALVRDAAGNPVSQAIVTFAAPVGGPTATFAGGANTATALTNNSGVATSPPLTANSVAGAFTVSASVAGLSATAAFALTNVAGQGIGLPSGLVVNPGGQISFPVSLPSPAAPGGVLVTLGSSDPSIATVSAVFILIPPGQTMSTAPKIAGLKPGTVTISASADRYVGAASTVVVAPAGP